MEVKTPTCEARKGMFGQESLSPSSPNLLQQIQASVFEVYPVENVCTPPPPAAVAMWLI